jgi:hypothetical protein
MRKVVVSQPLTLGPEEASWAVRLEERWAISWSREACSWSGEAFGRSGGIVVEGTRRS